jgi:hypothetical protein
MEIHTTKQAADELGVSVQKVHRAAIELGIEPVWKLPGRTGAKMWSPTDIEAIRQHLAVAS